MPMIIIIPILIIFSLAWRPFFLSEFRLTSDGREAENDFQAVCGQAVPELGAQNENDDDRNIMLMIIILITSSLAWRPFFLSEFRLTSNVRLKTIFKRVVAR